VTSAISEGQLLPAAAALSRLAKQRWRQQQGSGSGSVQGPYIRRIIAEVKLASCTS